jgi:hypothetical protein
VVVRTIGIRAKPSAFTFAIFDVDANCVVNVETVLVPEALYVPDALRYVRSTVLDLLREYGITKGCIRAAEPSARAPNLRRIQIEGVIQESFASSTLQAYFVGHISSISSRLGIPRVDFKQYVSGERNYEPIENWTQLGLEDREAVLAAIGARNA